MPSGLSALDFGAFSGSEKRAMLTAAKLEILRRMGKGRVTNGSSVGQQYGMTVMAYAELVSLINGLTVELGYQQPEIRVAPNFSGRANPSFAPAPAPAWSNIEPDIATWADLQALSTTGMPNSTIKIWVESETGITRTTRLLPSTAETNTDEGRARPDDYSDPGNARVWFLASS